MENPYYSISKKRVLAGTAIKTALAVIIFLFSISAAVARPPRELSFSPSSLSFSVVQNGTTVVKTSTLSANRGKPFVSLSKSGNSNWLILPTAKRGLLSFEVNASGLAPGTYTAKVTAYSLGYISGTLTITLSVTGPAALSFSPASIAFSVVENGTTPNKSTSLSASTGNPAVFFWKGDSGSWLVLPAPSTGSLSVGVNASGLVAGTYTTIVTAYTSGYANGTLVVTLTVTAAKKLSFSPASLAFSVLQNGTTGNKLSTLSASTGTPGVALAKSPNSSWLLLPSSSLGSLTFGINASGLPPATYTSIVSAKATGYDSARLQVSLVVSATAPVFAIKVNFQDSATPTPAGWLRDYGQSYNVRSSPSQGTGYSYGWLKKIDNTPLELTRNGRNRTIQPDVLLATLMHMQAQDIATFSGTRTEGIWQVRIPSGKYDVVVSVGDETNLDSKHSLNIEGVNAVSTFVPTQAKKFTSASVTVNVSDGFLTVDATGGSNTKINWITIEPSRPAVVTVNPQNTAAGVGTNSSISTDILKLPNAGINNTTITSSSVFLTENATGILVPSNVNGTGGGDAITLVPSAALKLNTTYKFNITSGVKDLSGASFYPYSSTFTTTPDPGSTSSAIQFDKVSLPNTTGRHSNVTIGPDGKLYALTIDGIIKRFSINPDGTLGTPQLIYALQDASGMRNQRLAIGFAFDPASTATNLIVWITYSTYVFTNGPEWDGKLVRLSGANLQTVQEIVINLPRSAKDHLTNSIAFGPDKALYFTQGSNSAMGRADNTWMDRNEHLLSCSVLRLDVAKLGTLPLNVKTAEGGGSYNPYALNAPLTIFASGVRNAFDLVWHSNGSLYVPTNGSGAGGNTPASVNGTLRPDGTTYNGPAVPALTNVQQTMNDYLFKVVKGGYYGHPNPQRGEYVMNGGNPTSGADKAEVAGYPAGTVPDVNWRGSAFDFKNNNSPDGVIEYKSNVFNGGLKGKLLVVRYSQHDDIITLTPGGDKDIASATEGNAIPGFSGFIDPLDLTEDQTNGNIYVSEYGGDSGRITLLRPNTSGIAVARSASRSAKDPGSYPNTIASCDEVNGANISAGNINGTDLLPGNTLTVPGFTVHPNPAHLKLNIGFPAEFPRVQNIQLIDIYGKIHNVGESHVVRSGSMMVVDVSELSLSPGVYFIKLTSVLKRSAVLKIILL